MAQLPIVITIGEPAGIGPDIVIQLAQQSLNYPIVVIADDTLLQQRAQQLQLPLTLSPWDESSAITHRPGHLKLIPLSLPQQVIPGQLNPNHSETVLASLNQAVDLCLQGKAAAMLTAPVHKGVVNQAGIPFKGQTEFVAASCQGAKPVMMLTNQTCRVALVTTHLPLKEVAAAITKDAITQTVNIVARDLQRYFGIKQPRLMVCGLNPHAGEDGYLGREEIEIINPALCALQQQALAVSLALPADTLFTPHGLQQADAIIAMYHDQGLPAIKSLGFGKTSNITLGLPIIRTSVDHGTALSLAGTGQAQVDSLLATYQLTQEMIQHAQQNTASSP